MESCVQEVIERMLEISGLEKDSDLARILKVHKSSLSNWKKRGAVPTDKILQFAIDYKVDPVWLKTGEGSRETETPAAITALVSAEQDAEHQFCIHQLDASAIAGRNGFVNQEFPDIVRSIYFSQQGLSDIVGIKNADGISMITVPTDSMSPTIEKGDIVFIDTRIDCYNGEGIYIFDLDGETYIKRLQKMPFQGMLALSDNQRYKPIPINEQDFRSAVIRGKFIRVLPINPKDL